MAKKKNKPSSSKKAKPVNKYKDPAYFSLYRKILYRKNKADELTSSGKRGYKAKRSGLYKEITLLNKELRELSRKKGYGLRRRGRVRRIERTYDRSTKTRQYTDGVWQFEPKLAAMLSDKAFDKIYIVNHGKIFYIKKSKPSTILYWYDQARNEAYFKPNAGTPFVDVTEDYAEKKLTLHILS